ncbi:DUF6089 family protein [Hymenobacter profundi]|uniref:Porin family protein n=1 Tax=Hymenobacter profundi TaxID=1982110 RepID=A0ABS6X2E1_9BACT|nr:DUF6089 family protein [Hymenobacter profundi]MBW3130002.1 porin family protein [Hymenobacter profundi]
MFKSQLFKTLLACGIPAGSVFFAGTAAAQNTSELGIGVGGAVYRGEIAPSYQFRNNRPAVTAFYRKDITNPVTLRGGLTYGMLRADDINQKGNNDAPLPLPAYRQAGLKGGLLEASAVIEYNFFDYHDRKDKIHFTPYVFAGIAGFYANTRISTANASLAGVIDRSGAMLGFAIPAGVGVKYAISPRWNLGAEVGARKTFTDNLDHLSTKNTQLNTSSERDLLINRHTQDWYFYNGISISYTFYKIRCPEGQ